MVHSVFDPNSVTLDEFFQSGYGVSSTYFQGVARQRGYGFRGAGIGSIFRSLLRMIIPLAKSAGKSVGKEALATSARILDNLAQGQELKETIKSEAREGVKRIAKRVSGQTGGGPMAKRRRRASKGRKSSKRRGGKFSKSKKKRITKKDLLGKKVIEAIAVRTPPKTRLGFY